MQGDKKWPIVNKRFKSREDTKLGDVSLINQIKFKVMFVIPNEYLIIRNVWFGHQLALMGF
jgi:hypothetical protein